MACVADVETWVDLRFMDSFVSPEYMEPFFSDNLSFSVLFIGSDFPLLFKTIALHPFCVGRACVGEKVWRDLEAYLEISERTEYLLTKTKQGSVPCVETGIKFLKENYPITINCIIIPIICIKLNKNASKSPYHASKIKFVL
eukprot:GHVP01069663.1.p1 GENE.GHVP01069663.1~~GHVP01069663.1.p1  ORF type:complete len:152 (+),score=12.85 GHVP01069663.1:31-456(+)